MPNAYIFNEADIRNMLLGSEGVALPGIKGAGHTGERHVYISNQALAQRMDRALRARYLNGEIVARTSFIDLADALKIGTLVLNSKEAEPVLTKLYGSPLGTREKIEDLLLFEPVRARYALGDGVARCLCWFATMILYRIHGPPPRCIHIRSFFPSFGEP